MRRHPDKPLYLIDRLDGRADLQIGKPEAHAGRFGPHVRAERWGGRVYLSIAARGVSPGPAAERLEDVPGKGRCVTAALRRIGGARPTNETHRWYTGNSLEWEIEWPTPADVPAAGTVAFDLDFPAGLAWYPQPALTADEIAFGAYRPDKVVGSYVARWPRSGRYLAADGAELVNYETGKFCHLFRPEVIDANGARAWCTQSLVGKALTIALPAAWMASAAYPITLDPTFGYTSNGGTKHSFSSQDYLCAVGTYSPAGNGNVTTIHVYTDCDTGTGNVTLALYDDSANPSSRMADGAGVALSASPQWEADTLDAQQAVTGGVTYWPAIHGDSDGTDYQLYYDSGTGVLKYTDNYGYTSGQTPASFGTPDGTLSDRDYSMYATYTESGGAAVAPTRALLGVGA